ncbi:Hsp70 family ATPase [Saccharomycopsis crataegensis]|uniref:Hsp70 family ATPase n=1 Tax=Saccharomycopsis crataegensis TaxID=43959 RepID=A0AAV5QNY1_9ASCO|nr:Hsp70 family ATPase [Saccharomycopsis crataegensis]
MLKSRTILGSFRFMRSYSLKVQSSSKSVIGIDLGTTNSAVAIVQTGDDQPKIIENQEGKRTTPSVVAFTKSIEGTGKPKVIVGEAAKRQSVLNSENTFFATKRLIGRRFKDIEVQRDLNNVPYKIVENKANGDAWLKLDGVTSADESKEISYSPAQIGGFILDNMKKVAETSLGIPIKNAVVTVPAYFNDSQRQATKDAGKIIGLNILRVINEPTAAALAYGLDSKKNGLVAVYDLGGGTFDISILDIDDGVFEVVATNGDTHLGGEDFDILLMNYVIDDFKKKTGINLLEKSSKVEIQRIREACEKAKIELSHVKATTISIPFIYEQQHINLDLTEDQLDDLSLPLINKTIPPVKKALKDADLEPEDIDEIILVGGMTRMPKIRKIVGEVFDKIPNHEVNPDEAVALGAAIQGAVLSGEIKDVLLLDVTPLTLGIETYGGIYAPLIPRNTTIPIKKTQVFSTGVDGQTAVDISVYQGERPLVKDNKLIGHFKLGKIPILPKGEPQIQVTFDIDADGIIQVKAKELKTDSTASITVSGVSGLTEADIEKMVNDAEKFKDQDKKAQVLLEHATRSDMLVNDTKNALEKLGKLIENASDNKVIQDGVSELQQMLVSVETMVSQARSNDPNEAGKVNVAILKKETDAIQKFSMKVFSEIAKVQASGN